MRNRRGFTLIETIVYLALFGIIIGGLVVAAYALFESSARNQTKAMMQEEKDFIVARIDLALSGAESVSTPTQSMLMITKQDASVGNRVALCLVVTEVRIATSTQSDNCADPSQSMALNNSNVSVSKLVFIYTSTGGVHPVESVEAGFTIRAQTPGGVVSQTASTTRYVRK